MQAQQGSEPVSNDEVADKAKFDAIAREKLLSTFAGKMCPLLSIGGLRPSAPALVVGAMGSPLPGSADGEALSCQGPNCMLFLITSSDEQRRPTGGQCSIALFPNAILQLRDTNVAIANQLFQQYKIKPRI